MKDVLTLAQWCKEQGIRLIVDESFVDFSVGWEENTLLHDNILEQYPSMLVMKSISKSYGVPGIRLGILCSADVDIISRIKKMVSIWNLNSFCEFFMQIYTKYEKDYKKACDRFIEERNDFEAKLRTIPFIRVIPSQANYFLVEVLPPFTAKTLVLRMLKEHNILMRDCSGKGGFDGKQYMRIAVRNHEDNTKLIDALRKVGESK
jgi:histidinol-phosphate/aromatic aminotransferase/cobyric acid decarboxylase-like protein